MEKHTAFDLLFETGLRHLYKSENEVYHALLTMAENAQSTQLSAILMHHREETQSQIERLKRIFSLLAIDIESTKLRGLQSLSEKSKEMFKTLLDLNFTDRSKGMEGILNEGKELMRHFKNTGAGDLALVSAGDKVEHFEIGCYTPLCLLADKFGYKEVFHLLTTSLKEERAMEEKMRHFAQTEIPMLAVSVS